MLDNDLDLLSDVVGMQRTQRISPFMASLRSTSFSSYSLPALASLKASL
jgi:hypothetical protein